jgi:predicted site-specific integrase-resolvase
MEIERLWTQAEVAKFLRVSQETLKRWRRTPGQGPPWHRVAGKPRCRRADFRRWLREQGKR